MPASSTRADRPDAALDFTAVYDGWFRQVYRWARAHGAAEADLEDLTQEVFAVVQRKLPEFDGEKLAAWLYRITTRVVRDHRRSAWFRNLFLRPRDVPLEELSSVERGPAERLEEREARAVLQALVRRMNPKWRAAFVLFEVEGMSGEEIAALEGIPPATLWTHLHRARKEFAALVAERLKKEEGR